MLKVEKAISAVSLKPITTLIRKKGCFFGFVANKQTVVGRTEGSDQWHSLLNVRSSREKAMHKSDSVREVQGNGEAREGREVGELREL